MKRQQQHIEQTVTEDGEDVDEDNEYEIKHNRVCAKIIELFCLQVREIFEDEE